MPEPLEPIRIRDLPLEAEALLGDDLFVVDGPTGGVRRLPQAVLVAAVAAQAGSDPLQMQVFARRDAVAPGESGEEPPPAGETDVLMVQVFS